MLPAHIPDNNSSFVLRDQTCQRFSLAEIELATNNFDEALVIGRGGYGKVYKSVTELGSVSEVAIKRLHSASTQGATEFEAEVKVLHKLRHANLVSLIGYCNEGKEMVLAYEFMPNGNLKDHIHESATELSWLQRLKICIGAARGLDYLHTGMSTQHGVIHRDVKTSNILLDKNFAAKISDFGLAKVGPINQTRSFVKTRVKGTFGYLDPSYFYSGKLTRKSDVYALGVVLLEVLSGKKAVDESLDEEQQSLVVWAQDHIKKGNLDDIIDHSLIEQATKKCLKEFASIAVKCLHYEPKQRLAMSEVVVKLESILSQERKNADRSIDEGRLIDKVRYFFTTKSELILDSEVGSSEVGAYNSKRASAELASKILGPDIRKYTYPELVSATNNFWHRESSRTSQEIIYKGWVDEHTYAPSECAVGLAMYVRRRHIGTSTLELQHGGFDYPNLVKLLGYCLNEQELYCVYELIPDASLDKLLFVDPGTTSLSWAERLKIALGAAQGLSFLHQRNHPAYNQFKAANILVDSDYNARLSDYELGKPYEGFSSYSHYTDPFSNGRRDRFSFQLAKFEGHRAALPSRRDGLILKSEIYNFGVVLLEILTGMKEFDESRVEGKQSLVKWATPLLADEENLGIIIDPLLQHNNNPPKGAFKFALLVSNCLQPTKEERPSMEEVFQILYLCCQEETDLIES